MQDSTAGSGCACIGPMFLMARSLSLLTGCLMILAGAISSSGQQAVRDFPKGSLRRIEDLPPGRLRTQIERLPAQARDRAVAWLGNFHFTELDLNSLQVDPEGGIFYADQFTLAPVAPAAGEPVVAAAPVPVSPFPESLRFHSRPGATNVLFINFSGENVTGTAWNTANRTTIPAVAFSTDGDFSTFNDSEQLAIKRIWQRMAEDYAPFNIDVTTERPAVFTTRTAHALITRNTDANGVNNPSSTAGGVAYVNVFGAVNYATYRPGWIYYNNLANDESYIAEAASHEIGHNMGLSHDGRTDGLEYYNGHGSGDTSWAPLMGTGYDRNVSQWSKGEYYRASNLEDDLAIIAAKISHLTDDHGNTNATATGLVILGGTNISATTPENDPARTNSANKGVLERNTDVDVFSFVTGSGPVDLTINPWIMPSGLTRGGNLDISVALYNASGTRLLTNNPALQTFARVQTNLIEGVYYLHIRNTAAGNPSNSTPSGYTAYGSIGQYFISGSVVPSGFVIPPGANLQITDITQPGTGPKLFTVTYSDNVAIDVSTLDGNDILVTGTNGYSQLAQLISVDVPSDGTPRTATYAINPPSGPFWTDADSGIYSVFMQTNQVLDTEEVAVPAAQLGQFTASVPRVAYFANMNVNPGWTLESQWEYGKPLYANGTGPTSGFTGTNILGFNLSGNYPNRLDPAYATTPVINCSSNTTLTLRFRRWLGLKNSDTAVIQVSTNGTTWVDVWSSTSAITDNSWQLMQYVLPAWVAGSPTVRLRWGLASNPSQNDIGWNIDDVEVLGDGAVDTTPPVSVINVANILNAGSVAHSFTVTYTDNSAVHVASLSSSNLFITGPNGYSNFVDYVGVDTSGDGTPRVASYSAPAPGGIWDAADNGSYQITLRGGQVDDTFNNAIAETMLGTFMVAIATNQQSLIVSPTLLSVPEGSNAVFTIRLAEQPSSNVVVTVLHVSGDEDLVVMSGATNVFTSLNWSNPVSVVIAALPDLDSTNGTAIFECHSDGLATVAVQAAEQENVPPSVAIVSPTNNASFLAPAGIFITASASDSDGTISKVEFFEGTNKLGETYNLPYSLSWINDTAGTYTLTAWATDQLGAVTVSEAVNITITNAPPIPVMLRNPIWVGSDFIFSFESQVGVIYDVQYTELLGGSNWFLSTTLIGNGSVLNVTNVNPSGTNHFYRIQSR
jgi:hypothetical protein